MSANARSPFLSSPPSDQLQSQTPAPTATDSNHGPKQLSRPVPFSPHTTLHIQITYSESSILAFLTTTDSSNVAALSSLGSFVYAMPNRFQPSDPFSTALYAIPSSVDFATRVAKIIAQRTQKPTYIGCSVFFGSSSVEEEIAGIKAAVDGIIGMTKTT